MTDDTLSDEPQPEEEPAKDSAADTVPDGE
jgi:hypothetical protein